MSVNAKSRIKDIADRAGVSVGTVDRVIHNRPNVSQAAREKVNKALKEMDYRPNMYASALAHNKTYIFYLILPEHESDAYWDEIEEGAFKAVEARRDFNIHLKIVFFKKFDEKSFTSRCMEVIQAKPNGVILVPTDQDTTKKIADRLHEEDIPFVTLDSYMPSLKSLSFFGQDSFASGLFAAKMLMLLAHDEKSIMIMKQLHKGKVTSKQQHNREMGFRHFMDEQYSHVKVVELNLPLETDRKQYPKIMEEFFRKNPEVHHGITFASKAHIVGNFLLHTNRRDVQIMGYDLVPKNIMCMKNGSISFLISQHAYMQGFSSVDTLFRAVVLRKEVAPINFVPIELLSLENIDFYRRTQL